MYNGTDPEGVILEPYLFTDLFCETYGVSSQVRLSVDEIISLLSLDSDEDSCDLREEFGIVVRHDVEAEYSESLASIWPGRSWSKTSATNPSSRTPSMVE